MSDMELVMLAGGLLLMALIGFFAYANYVLRKFDRGTAEAYKQYNEAIAGIFRGRTK